MNMGLLEARQLADAVAGALGRGRTRAALDAYAEVCAGTWRQLLGREALLQPGEAPSAWILGHAERILPCLPGSGDDLAQMARQLGMVVVGA
jgi:hypothetical protein